MIKKNFRANEWIAWVDYHEILKFKHYRANRCPYGIQEMEQALAEGYVEKMVRDSESNVKNKVDELKLHGWEDAAELVVGIYLGKDTANVKHGQMYIIDGGHRYVAILRVNRNKIEIPEVKVRYREYYSEEQMRHDFEVLNSNIVKMTKADKFASEARSSRGDAEEVLKDLYILMGKYGVSFSVASLLLFGYKFAHEDSVSGVSRDKYTYMSAELIDAWGSICSKYMGSKDKLKSAMYRKIKSNSFVEAFKSVLGGIIANAHDMCKNGAINEEEKYELLKDAFNKFSAAIKNKFSHVKTDIGFSEITKGRSRDIRLQLTAICEELKTATGNPIFDSYFRLSNKVAV